MVKNTPEALQKIVDNLIRNRGENKMVKNTPEALQKIVDNLIVDLYKHRECWAWDCSDCPLNLREPVPDCWGNLTRCGYLLLVTACSKILVK